MIVVNQKESGFINFKNIECVKIEQQAFKNTGLFGIIAMSISGNMHLLGEYKTEERCKEIIKALRKNYQDIYTTYSKGSSDYPIDTLRFEYNIVHMPKE